MTDNKEDKFFYFPMISMPCTGSGYKKKRLSQNKLEMASIVSSQIGFIRIFLKREVYKLSFEDFILSNCLFRCHKLPKRLLLQDYVQWPAGRTQFQPS